MDEILSENSTLSDGCGLLCFVKGHDFSRAEKAEQNGRRL